MVSDPSRPQPFHHAPNSKFLPVYSGASLCVTRVEARQAQQNKLCNVIIMLLIGSKLKPDFKHIICHRNYINYIHPIPALTQKSELQLVIPVFLQANIAKPIPSCWEWEIKGLIMKIL